MLSETLKKFIAQHLNDDTSRLLLDAKKYPEVNVREAVEQIMARQKAKIKLTTWVQNEAVVFPSGISVEQSSSEATAQLKASFMSGHRLIDLTGGMGVDTWAMAQVFEEVIYLERSEKLCQLAEHNFQVLGYKNIHVFNQDSVDFLQNNTTQSDWIYLDPARRDKSNQKVVGLADCEPNILEIKDLLFEKTENILLKVSPLLDIEGAIRALNNVTNVWTIAIENEVKEVLFALKKNSSQSIQTQAINLLKNRKDVFSFEWTTEKHLAVGLLLPKRYIYEPNAAILKTGAFKSVAKQFDLAKLHPHTHLYTSDVLKPDFQGRVFEVKAICRLDKKELLAHLPQKKANISIRNFPISVQEIRKKTGITEGGDTHLLATTNLQNQKIVLVCAKVL
jgi:precorrin-6B methylase 2